MDRIRPRADQRGERRMRRGRVTWLTVLTVSVCACGDGFVGGDRAAVTDSAGVRVVRNRPPDPGEDVQWVLGAEAELEIGVEDGLPEYQLFDVSDAVVLSDEVLVIANGGTDELRLYDGDGSYQRSAGGEGDGPGEFQDILSVDRFRGDSLLVFDRRQFRASVFDTGGRFARSFPLRQVTNSAYPSLVGVLSDGALVVREGRPYIAGEVATGVDRPSVALSLSDAAAGGGQALGVFPGDEMFVMAVPADMWMTVRPVTFGRRFVTAVASERIAVAVTDRFSIDIYDSEGTLKEIVRQQRSGLTIGARDVSRYNDSLMSTIEDERSRRHYREMFDLMPKHEVFPAFASMHFDRVGNLWVEDYGPPGDPLSAWQVFDERGLFAARVEVPGGLRVVDIGADYVLGVARDGLGVERVRLYRLDKAAG